MIPKTSLRYLFLASFLAWALNALLLNSWLAPQFFGEWPMVAAARNPQWLSGGLAVWITAGMDALFGGAMQGWRLPGVLLLLLTAALAWTESKKVFGEQLASLSLLVLSAGWLLIWSTKFASSDLYLFAFHWMAAIYLLLYLKRPQAETGLGFFLALALGTLVAPQAMLVGVFLLVVLLRVWHQQGKQLDGLYWYIWLPILLGGVIYWQGWTWQIPFSLFNGMHLQELWGWQILAYLPFIGFFLAGLWQMILRLRQGEELARILAILILVGWLSGSLLAEWAFALLIAQQLLNYLHPHYPYQAIVKAGSIFAMLGVFALGAWTMMTGYYYLGAPGFRAAMATSTMYWIPGFFAIVGLYGQNLRTVVWSSLLTAWLFFLVGMVQIGKLVNPIRHWTQQIEKPCENPPCYLSAPAAEMDWLQGSLQANQDTERWLIIDEQIQMDSLVTRYSLEVESAWQPDLDWTKEVIAWDPLQRRVVWLKGLAGTHSEK